jgi:hypothetical protein
MSWRGLLDGGSKLPLHSAGGGSSRARLELGSLRQSESEQALDGFKVS